MQITEAKKLVGKMCAVYWLDRTGQEIRTVSKIHDATFVPLYGGYLITDLDDLLLDRVSAVEILASDGTAEPVFGSPAQAPMAA